ncbi:hypothetical protein ACLOJK_009820 [Asimina triloba]
MPRAVVSTSAPEQSSLPIHVFCPFLVGVETAVHHCSVGLAHVFPPVGDNVKVESLAAEQGEWGWKKGHECCSCSSFASAPSHPFRHDEWPSGSDHGVHVAIIDSTIPAYHLHFLVSDSHLSSGYMDSENCLRFNINIAKDTCQAN